MIEILILCAFICAARKMNPKSLKETIPWMTTETKSPSKAVLNLYGRITRRKRLQISRKGITKRSKHD